MASAAMSTGAVARSLGFKSAAIAPADLADLIASFNEVTARLEATHDQLRAEVTRLNRDLTEANKQIERSRRLAALGEMAAGIAHEVRNPLGSIRLYARMLEQDLADRPEEQSTVRKIAGAAKALDGVVGDVLTFAREFKLRKELCTADELIDRAVEACSHDGVPGWSEAELFLPRHGEPAASVTIAVDPGLVVQALVNVVRNAFEAVHDVANQRIKQPRLCPLPHRVTIDAFWREEREGAGTSGKVGVIRVRDTGPGVSAEVVERMFNPFFTTRSTGTGLGLAIVHRIVDAHGGRVVVRDNSSTEDQSLVDRRGATVELVFPIEDE